MNAAQTVIDAVRGITFGPEATFQNLTMVPVLGGDTREPDYLTLDDALAGAVVEITELSDAGRVPELKVTVKGAKPVLLVDGEELVGAKQNRVLNLTILAPAGKTTVIPVSCVEAGRWRRVSHGFRSVPRAHFAEGRAAKMRQVTVSLLQEGERASNQCAVWDQIAEKSARLEARSDTSAMSALFDKLEVPLDEFVRALSPVVGQVGAVFFANGAPAGFELFDAPDTWRKLSPKLVRSYALDALDHRDARSTDGTDAKVMAEAIASAPAAVFAAAGEGEDVRLTGVKVVGAALVARGRAIHVSAFPNAAV